MIDTGFRIQKVWDAQWHELFDAMPEPGGWEHQRAFEASYLARSHLTPTRQPHSPWRLDEVVAETDRILRNNSMRGGAAVLRNLQQGVW